MRKLTVLWMMLLPATVWAQSPAQSSVQGSVHGTLTPAACTPVLAEDGQFDIGTVSEQDLSASGRTQLRSRVLELTITCNRPTRFALYASDDRRGTADWASGNAIVFGLGEKAGKRVGSYFIQLATGDVTVDGASGVAALVSEDNGATWAPHSDPRRHHLYNADSGKLIAYGLAGASEPLAVTRLTARLSVDLRLADKQQLQIAEPFWFSGGFALHLVYQ